MATISDATVIDLRFPTSRNLDGSDAMNPDPDYSAAYLRLATSEPDLGGHGFVFTIGRGNDIQAAAVDAVARRLVGRDVDALVEDPGAVNLELTWDRPTALARTRQGRDAHGHRCRDERRMGPAGAPGRGDPCGPPWRRWSPQRSSTSWTGRISPTSSTPAGRGRSSRSAGPCGTPASANYSRDGLAAYATTPGWLGYSDEKLVRLCHEAVADGFTTIKLKVGADTSDDRRRLGLAREAVGPDVAIAVDANQRWNVPEANRGDR